MRQAILLLFLAIGNLGCSNLRQGGTVDAERTAHQPGLATSLTFQNGKAEQAMNFYVRTFPNSRVLAIKRWGAAGPGAEGTVMQARFELDGQRFIVSDSPPVHAWDFTPAVSTYVECESLEALEKLFATLSEGGVVAMPLDNYGFSQRFGWLIDQFGVSWQLNFK